MLIVFCFNVSAAFNRPKYSFYFNNFYNRKFVKSKFIWLPVITTSPIVISTGGRNLLKLAKFAMPPKKISPSGRNDKELIKHQKQLSKLLLVNTKPQCLAT